MLILLKSDFVKLLTQTPDFVDLLNSPLNLLTGVVAMCSFLQFFTRLAFVSASLFILTSCGTTLKARFDSTVEYDKKNMVPVIFTYHFKAPHDTHEVFIFDQDDRRYQFKVSNNENTRDGFIVYLPANKTYFINSILHVRGRVRQEFLFGQEQIFFKTKNNEPTIVRGFILEPSQEKFGLYKFNDKQMKELSKSLNEKFKLQSSQ